MTRIDVPTLQCDRCKTSTQDENEMSRFRSLTGMYDKYQGASEKWDLCATCWRDFLRFIQGEGIVECIADRVIAEMSTQGVGKTPGQHHA